ncbi:MAG: trypsin-like peptidase domain-containing protein [Nocardioides sp.]|nr:trypsin-like peptidase domain-containing protein [Nocardioides sp.]
MPPVPWASYAAPPPPRRRHGLRAVALGTALAVVAAAGVAGFAVGRWHDGGQPSAGGLGHVPGASGQGGQGNGELTPFGGSPFSGPGSEGNSPFDSSSGTPASSDQVTGLVRVAATLKYQGGMAAGTGMILTSTGEVVTNHHVVEGATKIQVKVMSTGQTYRASVVGTDAKDDVAVLQLQDATGLATVTPDTNGIGVGDAVTAVGDAGGSASNLSAAEGKVIATGRHITTHSEDGHASERLNGLIEISSDVISGDSGGATYDAQGEVAGMTTAASSGTRDVVGYAIPIARVLRIAGDLEHGTVNARYEYGSPAFLGIGLEGNDTTVAGVYPGTPAARAGISTGDSVTRVGSTRVSSADALRQAIRACSPGDQVRVTWRDTSGITHIATVTLMAGPVA